MLRSINVPLLTHHGQLLKLGSSTWPMLGEACTGGRPVPGPRLSPYRHRCCLPQRSCASVGLALQAGGVLREQLHITSKVWWDQLQPNALRRLDNSLSARSAQRLCRPVHDPLAGQDWDLRQTIEALVAAGAGAGTDNRRGQFPCCCCARRSRNWARHSPRFRSSTCPAGPGPPARPTPASTIWPRSPTAPWRATRSRRSPRSSRSPHAMGYCPPR